MSAQYDASVALDRKLTAEETRELKISLMPIFVATGDSEASPEDINDLLDYAFAMVNNKKTVEYVIQELVGMEMEFCNAAVAEKVGAELSGFLKKAKGEAEAPQGSKIASLKSTSSEKGNALTMSGALGASREGGRNKPKEDKGGKVDNKKRDDRRGGDRKGRGDRNDRGGRGRGRSTHKEAFDRLSNGGRRGRDNDRRRRDEDRRGGRGGRGDGGRGGGRGGRFGGRGDRGNRRSRDEYEDNNNGESNDDFVPMRDGGRGRGRGRGREGRGGAKRARYDEDYDEGYGNGGYYDEGYGYDDGYGYGGYHGYGGRGRSFRGGRGRGRFGGRGRGRGRGRGGPPPAEGGEGAEAGKTETPNASDADNHPSPMVQMAYSGGRFGGRGRFGRGRGGRGRGGGRAHVVSMIQSKTWVRSKPDPPPDASAAPPAE